MTYYIREGRPYIHIYSAYWRVKILSNKSRIQADGDGLDHRQSVKNLQTYQGSRASMLYTIEELAL